MIGRRLFLWSFAGCCLLIIFKQMVLCIFFRDGQLGGLLRCCGLDLIKKTQWYVSCISNQTPLSKNWWSLGIVRLIGLGCVPKFGFFRRTSNIALHKTVELYWRVVPFFSTGWKQALNFGLERLKKKVLKSSGFWKKKFSSCLSSSFVIRHRWRSGLSGVVVTECSHSLGRFSRWFEL